MAADSGDNVSVEADEHADVTVSPLRPDVPAPLRSRGRFWYRVVGGVVLAALLLAGTLAWLHPKVPGSSGSTSQPPRPSDPLTLDINSAGMPCLDGAAWSPDGRSFVLAGNSKCIGSGADTGEALIVFNGRTGTIQAKATIENTLIQRNLSPPDGATWAGTQIDYAQPLWSPDGRRIVVTFEAAAPNANGSRGEPWSVRDGIVVLDSRLSPMRIFGGMDGAPPPLGVSNFGPVSLEQWDLATGTASTVTMPMGLSYTWGAGDRLTASDVLPQAPDAPPPIVSSGAVGNPLGGRAFTLWQEGDVYFANGAGCPGMPAASAPNYFLMLLTTSAWSPDGRYLALDVGANGRLPMAAPAQPTPGPSGQSGCTNFGPASNWPQLPIRDAGMRAALALVNGTTLQSLQFAWSPDGRRVAVAPSDVASGAPALTIYDCAGGRVLRQLSTADIVPSQGGGQPFSTMAWSPDGTRLLLVPEGPLPIVHVLGPKSLGG